MQHTDRVSYEDFHSIKSQKALKVDLSHWKYGNQSLSAVNMYSHTK